MVRMIAGVLAAVLLAGCAGASGPDVSGPDGSEPEVSGPDASGPDAPEPDVSGPDAPQDSPGTDASDLSGEYGAPGKYTSVRDAARALEEHVDLAILVPDELDDATVVDVDLGDYPGGRGATLVLELSDGATVGLDYGGAAVWGCDDGAPRPDRVVRIGPHRGILRDFGSGVLSLHWPATRRNTSGFYGITGEFPPERILRWARSMVPVGNREVPDVGGC